MANQPNNRQNRRTRYGRTYSSTDMRKVDLPGPLRLLTNPKVFLAVGVIFAAAIMVSVLPIFPGGNSSSDAPVQQMNELKDQPLADVNATPSAPSAVPTPIAKRYEAAPAMAIDTSKRYVATIKTGKGDIQVELNPREAPEAVNSFVFLAREGYYNNTPFMQVSADDRNPDGRFVAQAGDPTRTGLGSPGYSIKKETSTLPFARGSVGMGGSSPTSNGGQFFISYGDYPALNGKYTIFGKVLSGQDVLDRLTLLNVASRGGSGDSIISVTITES